MRDLKLSEIKQICEITGLDARESIEAIKDADYLLLTDNEAQELAKEEIENSLWAFNPRFLSVFTGFKQEVFEAIQANNLCEDNNEVIRSLVDAAEGGIDEFVEEAINADGRGHFISHYDGIEEEIGENLFFYRIN